MKPFLNINVDDLVRQRNTLVDLQASNPDKHDDLEGTINFLEHVMDIAEGHKPPEWVVNFQVVRRQ